MSNKRREKKRKRKLKKRRLVLDVGIGPLRPTGEFKVDVLPQDPDNPSVISVKVGLGMTQDRLLADIEIEDEA